MISCEIASEMPVARANCDGVFGPLDDEPPSRSCEEERRMDATRCETFVGIDTTGEASHPPEYSGNVTLVFLRECVSAELRA